MTLLRICLLLLGFSVLTASDVKTAYTSPDQREPVNAEVLKTSWHTYFSNRVRTEVEIVRIRSTNWHVPEKIGTQWKDYRTGTLLFVLNQGRDYSKEPDGILISDPITPSRWSILVQKRRRIERKTGDWDARTNGTEFSYIDMIRFIKESPDEYIYSTWDKKTHPLFSKDRLDISIRVAMVPSPANVAFLGLLKAAAGEFTDASLAVPYYIRKSEAVVKWRGKA